MALAFLAFGLWLRLGRLEQTVLRGWLFVPISLIIFFCHTYGWGLLGLMCFSAERSASTTADGPGGGPGIEAALHASVMALPLLVMLLWRSEAHGGQTVDWFNWKIKWRWIYPRFATAGNGSTSARWPSRLLVFVYAMVSRS